MSISVEQLVQVGVSHGKAPLDLLERLTVRADAVPGLLAEISVLGATKALVLSTCSRCEIYARTPVDPARLIEVLARQTGVSPAPVRAVAQERVGAAALEHLLRVTAGLESRVVGEVDIQRQVRTGLSRGTRGRHRGPAARPGLSAGAPLRRRRPLPHEPRPSGTLPGTTCGRHRRGRGAPCLACGAARGPHRRLGTDGFLGDGAAERARAAVPGGGPR